jgi:hypothetical protein
MNMITMFLCDGSEMKDYVRPCIPADTTLYRYECDHVNDQAPEYLISWIMRCVILGTIDKVSPWAKFSRLHDLDEGDHTNASLCDETSSQHQRRGELRREKSNLWYTSLIFENPVKMTGIKSNLRRIDQYGIIHFQCEYLSQVYWEFHQFRTQFSRASVAGDRWFWIPFFSYSNRAVISMEAIRPGSSARHFFNR